MIVEMQRWEIDQYGLQNLQLRSVPCPSPTDEQIIVKVEAVSLNYRDGEVVEHGMGGKHTFPFTPASDMAGTVVNVGKSVKRFRVGDRVISSFLGGWIDGKPRSRSENVPPGGRVEGMLSQYVCMHADWCVAAPASLTSQQACTLPVAGLTAWMALIEQGNLKAGETVVIQGTGGVSIFAIQFAAMHGAKVIVTTSNEKKAELAKKLGAHHCINRSKTPDWETEVLELTDGIGADHILEMAGGENVEHSIRAIANGGRISLIGLLKEDRFSASMLKLLSTRASMVAISVGPRRVLEDLIKAIDLHKIIPQVESVYAFSEVPEAFAHLQRGAFGKVVVQVSH